MAIDTLNRLYSKGIIIKTTTFEEALKCCIFCKDINNATYIMQIMMSNNLLPQTDIMDDFLEFYEDNNDKNDFKHELNENNILNGLKLQDSISG
jgi:hypothetical protein